MLCIFGYGMQNRQCRRSHESHLWQEGLLQERSKFTFTFTPIFLIAIRKMFAVLASMAFTPAAPLTRASQAVCRSRTVMHNSFDAGAWHRQRRREILAAHPEVRELIGSDAWVASFGLLLLPAFGWMLVHSPDMTAIERLGHLWGIGSLRSTWAVCA